MSRWAGARHIGLLILLLNVLVVAGAAMFRHATADDNGPREANAQTDDGAPLQPSLAQFDAGRNTDSPQADPIPPAPFLAPAINENENAVEDKNKNKNEYEVEKRRDVGSDPVLEELRNLIRDPDSDLDMPPLKFDPISSQPTAPVTGTDRWVQLQARAESVHHIALAARKLSSEAQILAKSGVTGEADVLMQRVVELHAMLQHLTTSQRVTTSQ